MVVETVKNMLIFGGHICDHFILIRKYLNQNISLSYLWTYIWEKNVWALTIHEEWRYATSNNRERMIER